MSFITFSKLYVIKKICIVIQFDVRLRKQWSQDGGPLFWTRGLPNVFIEVALEYREVGIHVSTASIGDEKVHQ